MTSEKKGESLRRAERKRERERENKNLSVLDRIIDLHINTLYYALSTEAYFGLTCYMLQMIVKQEQL